MNGNSGGGSSLPGRRQQTEDFFLTCLQRSLLLCSFSCFWRDIAVAEISYFSIFVKLFIAGQTSRQKGLVFRYYGHITWRFNKLYKNTEMVVVQTNGREHVTITIWENYGTRYGTELFTRNLLEVWFGKGTVF